MCIHYTQPAICSVTLQASKGRHLQVNKSRPRRDNRMPRHMETCARDERHALSRGDVFSWEKGEVAANRHDSPAQNRRRCVQDNAGDPRAGNPKRQCQNGQPQRQCCSNTPTTLRTIGGGNNRVHLAAASTAEYTACRTTRTMWSSPQPAVSWRIN